MSNTPKKVLIAEDSSVIQTITKKVLEVQNCQITAVKNGRQVLEKLENEDFDVILMDINMPIMDGMECARHVRSFTDRKKAAIPIIAITGNARNYTMEDFKEVGINEYLQKPINFDKLVETVHRFTS